MKATLFALFFIFYQNIAPAHSKEIDHYLNIIDNHPKVQAVQEQQNVLLYQAEGAMGLPDPTIFFGVDNVPISDPSFDEYLPSSKTIGFSQNIPNNRGRKAKNQFFLSSASIVELLVEYTTSRLYAQFFTRLAELQKVKQQTDLEEKKKQIIAQLRDYYEGQIVAGEPLYQKTFLTELEISDIEQTINTLRSQQAFLEADLIQLIGEVPDLDEVIFQEKKWNGDLNDLYPVRLASRQIGVEQTKVDVADSDYSPDFGLVGTYKIREDGENDSFDGDDWFSIQLRVSIPLWASKNQLPKLEAAKSLKNSAEHKYRETLRKWRMEIVRLESARNASALNLEVLRKKDVTLRNKIKAMERTYSAGQTNLEPVLQAEITRLSLLSRIAGEEAQYTKYAQELSAHITSRDSNDTI